MDDSDLAPADNNSSNVSMENAEELIPGLEDNDDSQSLQNLVFEKLSAITAISTNPHSIAENVIKIEKPETDAADGYMPVDNESVLSTENNTNLENVTFEFKNDSNQNQTPCENETTNGMEEDLHTNEDENDMATNDDGNGSLHNCLHTETFKIFVSNLPPGFLDSDLKDLCDPYGEVVECEIFAKNYAFVHMKTEESGQQALWNLNGLEIRGCKINAKKSNHCTVSTLPGNKKRFGADLEVRTYKIFVGRLDESVTKDILEKIVLPFGRIVEMEIYRNSTAFLHMETEEAGKKVIEELNNKVLPELQKSLLFSIAKSSEGPSIPTIRLQVKQVATTVTAAVLRELFIPYGLVLKVTIFPEIDPKSNSRQAIVQLEQFGNIRSAIKDLTGKELEGSKLSVEPYYGKEPTLPTIPKQPLLQPPPFSNKRSHQQWPPFNNGPITRIPRNTPPGRNFPPPQQPSFNNTYGPSPIKQMRLIPMPSEAELQQQRRFGQFGGGRGRVIAPPPRFQQNFSNDNFGNFNQPNSQHGYKDEGYGDYNDFQNETGNNPFNHPGQFPNFSNWNNSRNFFQPNQQKFQSGAPRNPQQNNFPNFPPAREFPQGPPPPLMNLQVTKQEDHDWSSDVPLPGFEEFSGAAEANSNSMNAVPFDYAQARKQLPPPPKLKNANAKYYYNQKGKLMYRGERGGGGRLNKKGKARRPGFGSDQQQKKFANQSGNDVAVESESSQPGPSSEGFFSQSSESVQSVNPAAASAQAPPYSQKPWLGKNKQQKNFRPSVKQMKIAEEEQKKQYSDYLRDKPWLYQSIPGTVKRV